MINIEHMTDLMYITNETYEYIYDIDVEIINKINDSKKMYKYIIKHAIDGQYEIMKSVILSKQKEYDQLYFSYDDIERYRLFLYNWNKSEEQFISLYNIHPLIYNDLILDYLFPEKKYHHKKIPKKMQKNLDNTILMIKFIQKI
jgi:hypothetical protein